MHQASRDTGGAGQTEQAGKAGELYTRAYRYSYTATQLQRLDHGAPVQIYTVRRELGHGSEEVVRNSLRHKTLTITSARQRWAAPAYAAPFSRTI